MEPLFQDLLRRLEQLSAQVEELRESLRQAVSIAGTDPEMSLSRARKALEYIVRDVYQRAFAEPAGTRPLGNLLQRLVKEDHFPKRLAAYASSVRELGNIGTHGFRESVTAQDVYQSLTQLLPIIEWYLPQKAATSAALVRPGAEVGQASCGASPPVASGFARPEVKPAPPDPGLARAPGGSRAGQRLWLGPGLIAVLVLLGALAWILRGRLWPEAEQQAARLAEGGGPQVTPGRVIYGPKSGKLLHQAGEKGVEFQRAGVSVRDGVVEATFINPYDAAHAFGCVSFDFRAAPRGEAGQYRVGVSSDGKWYYGHFDENIN